MSQKSCAVVLIGRGAIARHVSAALAADPALQLVGRILRDDGGGAAAVDGLPAATSLAGLGLRPDIVADCAGHGGLAAHGPQILAAGIDMVTVSAGAMAHPGLAEQLEAAARRGGARLQFASGAIGGTDCLAAAAAGGLDHVRYTGRKPPAGWRGTPAAGQVDLDRLSAPHVHFRGSARQAARLYPRNANVAATIALAGIGLDRTEVELVADPAAPGNLHEVEAAGPFGTFRLQLSGRPLPDNPASSALAAMSVLAALRRRTQPLWL
ncbi:MAG: aspartate dehydrogenase [Sneathiellaceae bacterium]